MYQSLHEKGTLASLFLWLYHRSGLWTVLLKITMFLPGIVVCSEINGIKPRVLTQQGQADAVRQTGGKVTRSL